MAKLKPFITEKELRYIEAINKEIHQDIVRQYVYYYAIIADYDEDDVYGERVQKTVTPPVKMYPRILFSQPEQIINEFGPDIKHEIEVYFSKIECDERGVTVRAGDFINYSNKFFEIASVVESQLPLGRPEEKIEYRAICIQSRKLQFDFPVPEEDSTTSQFSGALDVTAQTNTGDALDRWANVPEDEDT